MSILPLPSRDRAELRDLEARSRDLLRSSATAELRSWLAAEVAKRDVTRLRSLTSRNARGRVVAAGAGAHPRGDGGA